MTSVPTPTCSVAILGAGPYGLSVASHLRHAGVDARVFGEPMEFWRKQMPTGMILRSRKRSSHIADPERTLTLDHYGKTHGNSLSNTSLAEFLDYARWFQEQSAPDIDQRKVGRVDVASGGYRLTLQDGDVIHAQRVVVAAGLFPFAWRPDLFDSLPPSLVSHSSEHDDLSKFAGRSVMVVGGGQSALESAALLREGAATVEILARAPSILWLQETTGGRRPVRERILPPTDVGGRVTGWIAAVPGAFRGLPRGLRPTIAYRCTKPAGAPWLVSRLADVPIRMQRAVISVEQQEDRVRLRLDDNTERVVDHVLLGTGYRVDVSRYPFLPKELTESLDLVDGYPQLGPGFESSLPGLHFVGAPAAMSFGPIMRFVVGTWYAGPALTRRVLGKRQHTFATSLPVRIRDRGE